jgi:actin-related protein 5
VHHCAWRDFSVRLTDYSRLQKLAMAGLTATGKRPRRMPDLALREPAPHYNAPITSPQYASMSVPSSTAIVIDVGSSALRAGFSADKIIPHGPRLHYPPFVARGRDPTLIGYEALTTASRSAARTPYDGGIPNNANLLERLLDGTMLRLGLGDLEAINHPVVLTEPVCQPNAVRAYFSELMFEGYQVPTVCFGIDALFSYLYNSHSRDPTNGIVSFARRSGLVVSCGYHSTHILPVHDYKYEASSANRINVGGHHMTASLTRRLQLLQPDHAASFSYARVEALKHDVCYVSRDYDAELREIRDNPATFDSVSKIVKMPIGDGTTGAPALSAEDQERARLLRIERGKRLADMMKERARMKAVAPSGNGKGDSGCDAPAEVIVTEDEAAPFFAARSRLHDLQRARGIRATDEDVYYLARANADLATEEVFTAALAESKRELEAARVVLGAEKVAVAESVWLKKSQEDELIAVADTDLTALGLKRKRHLKALRGAAESRLRSKRQKAEREEAERQRLERVAKVRAENPELYIAGLRRERAELASKIRRRAAAKDAGSDRRSLAARERMRLLAQHAGTAGEADDKASGVGKKRGAGVGGKKEAPDTFGKSDADWDVYRDMRVAGGEGGGDESDEDGSKEEQKRLEALRAEILDMHPDDDDPTLLRPIGSALLYVPHGQLDEVPIVVDRIRTAEMIFQPSIIGNEQVGIGDAIESVVRRFESEAVRRAISCNVFVTGGVSRLDGIVERMQGELRARFPTEWGDGVAAGVSKAKDGELDAWRGAALFAEAGGDGFARASVTKAEYEEKGADYLAEHAMGNMFVPTPYVSPEEVERRKKMNKLRNASTLY